MKEKNWEREAILKNTGLTYLSWRSKVPEKRLIGGLTMKANISILGFVNRRNELQVKDDWSPGRDWGWIWFLALCSMITMNVSDWDDCLASIHPLKSAFIAVICVIPILRRGPHQILLILPSHFIFPNTHYHLHETKRQTVESNDPIRGIHTKYSTKSSTYGFDIPQWLLINSLCDNFCQKSMKFIEALDVTKATLDREPGGNTHYTPVIVDRDNCNFHRFSTDVLVFQWFHMTS